MRAAAHRSDSQAVEPLRLYLGRRGAQAELAQQLGIRARYGSDVLRGRREISQRLLERSPSRLRLDAARQHGLGRGSAGGQRRSLRKILDKGNAGRPVIAADAIVGGIELLLAEAPGARAGN